MKAGFHEILAATLMLVVPVAGICSDVSFAYQGLLLDEKGHSLSTRNHNIVFRIYDQPTGGTPLWSCQRDILLDDKGQFSVELSGNGVSGESLGALFASHAQGSLYIGLTVTGDTGEISPRQKLLSVPKALWAADSVAARNDMAVTGALSGNAASLHGTKAGSLAVTRKLKCGSLLVNSMTNANLAVNGSIVGRGTIPIRGIVVWSGSQASIPNGWALCDGGKYNNLQTPDLRDRFIVGAGSGSNYKVGEKNGEAMHTLSAQEMPSHAHGYTFKYAAKALAKNGNEHFYSISDNPSYKEKSASTDASGGGWAHENRPPYYALCYIMRVK